MTLPRPHPAAMAAVAAACALTVVYALGPIHRSSAGAYPAGIVSWATIGGIDPLEDYVWFALAMLASAIVAFGVLRVYAARLGPVEPERPPRDSASVPSRKVRTAFLVLIAVVAVAWTVRASAFDPFSPIRDDPTHQSRLAAGLRLDPFHDGERLGFLPAVLASAQPFEATFFIHGFGVDLGPALVGKALLPGLDIVLAMRIGLIGQLVLTCLASLWVVKELAGTVPTGDRTKLVLAVGLVTLALATRSVHPHMLLSIVQLALVLRGIRVVDAPGKRAQSAILGVALGLTLPLGLLYSYSGLVASVAMSGVAVGIVLLGRGKAGLGWTLGVGAGVGAGLIVLTALVGPASLAALSGQVEYWLRWGQAIWDRPPALGAGPLDVVLPALLAACLIQVLLIVWLAFRWYRRRSWCAWLNETRNGWVLLAFAALGARDALDRGGYDYGERALAAAGFGLAYLAMIQVRRFEASSASRRGLRLAVVLGVLIVVGQTVLVVGSMRREPDQAMMPTEFRAAPAAMGTALGTADCVYTLTSEGLWYLAFDRPSCSPFHQLAYARTDQAQAEVVADLARRRPPVIVYANETSYALFDGLSPSSANATVVRWVLRHYRPAHLVDGAWLWSPGPELDGPGPVSDGTTPIQLDSVQRGTERSVTAAVDGVDAEPGDAIYVTVDAGNSPVAAAPVHVAGEGLTWTVRVPTFDLAPGPHLVGFWLGPATGGPLRQVASGALTVEPRTTRPDLGAD